MRKNKLLTKKPNKLLTGRHNYFDIGGGMELSLNTDATSQVGSPGQAPNITVTQSVGGQPSNAGTGGSGMFGGIAQLAGQATADIIGVATANKGVRDQANSMIANAKKSMVAVQGSSDNFDQLTSDWTNLASLRNVSKYDLGYQKAGKLIGNSFQAAARGGAAGSALGPWGMLGGAIGGQVSSLFKSGIINRAAKKAARRVNATIQDVRDYNNRALANRAANIMDDTLSNLNYNYAAFGGPMDFGGGAIGYDFMNQYLNIKELAALGQDKSLSSLPNSFAEGGGIHIKEANKGKFTKYCGGNVTSECIARGKRSSSPAVRKRATFAANARKWKHAFGGDLLTHGANFDTGVTLVGNGGTHEENPLEGVPMGVDAEGTPNLVEEGEVIFNDYVFSNRLRVPKEVRKKYKLRGTKPLTFAEAATQMSKESEERPNDPISKAGLIDSMTKLMSVQEQIRERKGERQFARGGHLFDDGGWSQTLNYNNSTPGLTFGQAGFNPYKQNGTIDWSIMYGAESPFMKRRNYVINNWDSQEVKDWLPKYVQSVNTYNQGREGYTPLTIDGLTKDIFSRRTADRSWGGMHAGIDLAGSPEPPAVPREKGKRMYLTNRHDASGTPLEDLLIPDYDPTTGTYKYVRTGNSSEGNVDYTDLFYEERPAEPPKEEAPDLTGKDDGKYPNYDNTLRYMPIIGSMIGLGTSLFTKPDDSDASAILEASSGKGAYRPVRYRPIGNYLTYRPFDRDYYINKMNAEAGASRRALMNTSGGNRATAMAGILGADNNYLNQLGMLARQAEEYNLAQRQQVEEFNRATNIQNSQGFLQADMANQEALSKARDFTLRGVMAAADIRSRARLAREQAISDNLSNIFSSLGDIGREKVDRKWRTWASKHGVYAPVQKEAYGGRIKRKKRGLTF